MRRILKYPAVNAIGISLFSSFYTLVFYVASRDVQFEGTLYFYLNHDRAASFWTAWSEFLAFGHHAHIASVLFAVTALIVLLLIVRRRPYDEYHIMILIQCLVVAIVLTLIAIAAFYLAILSEPDGIVEKFTLFIVVHWATVVFADLAYVLLCKGK